MGYVNLHWKVLLHQCDTGVMNVHPTSGKGPLKGFYEHDNRFSDSINWIISGKESNLKKYPA
jgi:hypothetical protein